MLLDLVRATAQAGAMHGPLLVRDKKFYLIDVLRGRFDYPTLRSRAIAHAQAHKPHKILIEDAGVGTALVSELKRSGFDGHRRQAGTEQDHPNVNRIGEIRSGVGAVSAPSALAPGS
jgi:phage terminase large subunit-like protein